VKDTGQSVKREKYEAPRVSILGSVSEVTLGAMGMMADGISPTGSMGMMGMMGMMGGS
jgi:hypothetical protein